MSEKPNILFIVEGERLESEVINRMAEVYGLRCDISSVCTNIHILYQQLKKDYGYSDVISALQKILRSLLTRWKSFPHLQNRNIKSAERSHFPAFLPQFTQIGNQGFPSK